MLAQSSDPEPPRSSARKRLSGSGSSLRGIGGMEGYCRECSEYRFILARGLCGRCYQIQWRAAHPGRAAEIAKRSYAKHPERSREYSRRYRAAHPEEQREYQKTYRPAHRRRQQEHEKAYYVLHRQGIRERGRRKTAAGQYRTEEYHKYARSYRAANRERIRARLRNYYARKRGAEGEHNADDIALIRQQQEGRCWYCGEAIEGAGHIDHQIPLSRGGSNAPDNLVLACKGCNCAKGARTPAEFVTDQLANLSK